MNKKVVPISQSLDELAEEQGLRILMDSEKRFYLQLIRPPHAPPVGFYSIDPRLVLCAESKKAIEKYLNDHRPSRFYQPGGPRKHETLSMTEIAKKIGDTFEDLMHVTDI